MIPFDIYKDVHKAVRVNLFDVTAAAGRLDASDRDARIAHAARVSDLVEFLVFHAKHEDEHLDAVIAQVLPGEAEAITAEHVALEATMEELKAIAYRVFDETSSTDARTDVHELYMELALFTSRYLAHQNVEERVVMPALFEAFGFDAVLAMDQAIVASIPPDEMAWCLAKMLPAMDIDDRYEMLAGMRAGAPAEVYAGVLALGADVLTADDHAALVARLDGDLVTASTSEVAR
jgi:hypothetical protein